MTKFTEGKPCIRGHTKKYAKTGGCVECASMRAAKSDAKKCKDVNYWSLCNKVVIVPNVNKLFWEAMRVSYE